MENRDRTRFQDILNAIEGIERCQRDHASDYTRDHAIAYLIAVIGEAAASISKETQTAYPALPWSAMIGTRHRIIHGYANVNHALLKKVVEHELPVIRAEIQKILSASS